MKKGMIVTLYDDFNYGNKLQNYAVYKLLSDRKINVINVKNNRHLNYQNQSILKAYIKFYLSKLKWFFKKRTMYGYKYYKKRKNNFKIFSKQIKTTKDYFSYNKLSKFDNNDFLFVGSDQVWNPFMALDDLTLFSGFKNGKKISISASFGVSELEKKTEQRIKKSLESFSAISVRELSGKKIVDSLTNRNCNLLVDPTMAIEKSEWESQIKKPLQDISKKYILLVFLGEIDQELYNKLEIIAEKNDYEIIDLYKKNSIWTSCGPSEFLYLEKNASLICTDSFHSAVFGIIFNAPILVTGRNGTKENMNSRIETLLSKFNLESRKYNGNIDENIFKANYNFANEALEKEQTKYQKFLDGALNNEGD